MEPTIVKKERTALQIMLSQENVVSQFNRVLGEAAPAFIASIADVGMTMPDVARFNPSTIISSALIAATLKLPINKSLGFAWIIPYGKGQNAKAQFQVGYKGFIQLAQRTGQYKSMNLLHVYKNQFKSWSALTETFEGNLDLEPEGTRPVGFLFYFELISGFRKTIYKTREALIAHGKKYSKAFNSDDGTWRKDPDAMCAKTLISEGLRKWGPMSTEISRALRADQAVVMGTDFDNDEAFVYVDNDHEQRKEISTDPAPLSFGADTSQEPLPFQDDDHAK
jgi:recombination protein RecT